MMQLNNAYNRDDFLKFLEDILLTDFNKDIRPVSTRGFSSIQKAYSLGKSKNLDLQVFEFSFKGSPNKRVTLTKDAFHAMRSHAIFRALAIFHSPESDDWRLSLMTATPGRTEKGKVSLSYSNPKRLSFFLGPNAKVNTPTKFILKKDRARDFEDLKSRFSIEVVNKEFYNEISKQYIKLVGGTIGTGRNEKTYKPLLKLPSLMDYSQTSLEFGVRLIGRIIFCWFLREKKSSSGKSLMPKDLLSYEAIDKNPDYYHRVLEPIFFEVLNKPVKLRVDDFSGEIFSLIPYLNGGLFSPHEDDYYRRSDRDLQSQFHNILKIPDTWFKELFEILETYNFTIDENTTFDEELSIDPEMLGRIFENLLAEINPETGESARKSTGSYYTPRTIVNYMVDESLLLFIKEQTGIKEEKLRAIISYDLSDDSENPVTALEKGKIIDALEKVKILDPACGSGAFPIGSLQKIVFILQQIDPEGHLWFKRQIKNAPPEIRRVIEREFANKNFDYIRKLGIIRENIYGVDIQPIATEISRLRCFLTLVVDQKVDDSVENRGIEPLPNLDFKFVTANSLIGLPKLDNPADQPQQTEMFDDREKINELKSIRDQYFTASGIEREQLKSEFINAQKKLVFQLIEEHGFVSLFKAELTQKLSSWEPFSHRSAEWFDPEWMFGVKDGFDIVIANPPYGANIDKNDLEVMKKRLIDTKNTNSAAIFIDFAKNSFLNERGVLSYIVPKSLLYSEEWFDLVMKLVGKVTSLVDVEKAFENVLLEQVVFVFGKATSTNSYLARKFLNDEFLRTTSIRNKAVTQFKAWICDVTNNELEIASKIIEDERTTLLDKISTTKRGVGLQKYLKSDGSIPVIGGKNILRYGLNGFKGYLSEKDFASNKSKVSFMKQPKIVSQNIVAHVQNPHPHLVIIASYDDKGNVLTLDTVNNTVLDMDHFNYKYILAIMNSTLVCWFAYKFIYCAAIRTMHFDSNYVGKIPIITADDKLQKQFIDVVDKITSIAGTPDYPQNTSKKDQVKGYEKQIDQMVYKLYGLTPEEVEIVEGKNG